MLAQDMLTTQKCKRDKAKRKSGGGGGGGGGGGSQTGNM